MDDLLPIGRFARLAGLSIGALRHYHELGLLEPARVDPDTSYRSYARAQLDDARLIARLRELDLALPEIRAILGADAADRRRLLGAHRSRLMALQARVNRQIHWLNRAIDHEEPIMTASTPATLDAADRRQLAVDLFNHVWTLLEKTDRTPMQDDEMLHAAHASRYHWGEVGEPVNFARGEWQCSRVYAVLGRAEPALVACAPMPRHLRGARHRRLGHRLRVGGHRAGGRPLRATAPRRDAALARARELAAASPRTRTASSSLSDLATIG